MDKDVIEKLLENEKDWRKHMLETQQQQSEKLQKLSDDMSGLKIRVATLGTFFGMIGAYVKTKLHL